MSRVDIDFKLFCQRRRVSRIHSGRIGRTDTRVRKICHRANERCECTRDGGVCIDTVEDVCRVYRGEYTVIGRLYIRSGL